METVDVAGLFRELYRREPAGVWSAPGRVNLIGEHTDYNDGLVLPFAISARARLAAGLREDSTVRLVSAQKTGSADAVPTFDLTTLRPGDGPAGDWTGYLLGVLWVLIQDGHPVPGLDLVIDSSVPAGAGLSSSAALECVTALAVSDLLGLNLSKDAIARVAQRAENDFVGVPCGLMDQMASSACTAGHALYFDVQAATVQQVPFDPQAQDLTVLVIDTRVHHQLADGEYAKRRASCDLAARTLGVPSLRHIELADLDRALAVLAAAGPEGEVLVRRARHIVTENARVATTAELLSSGQVTAIGEHLDASHVSMRDDFEITCEEIDLAAAVAQRAGAVGARMTGGGFGGSVIALVTQDSAESIGQAVVDAFAERGWTPPVVRPMLPSAGARRD